MSIAQLERAATAPHRWIALSSPKDRNKDGIPPSGIAQPIKDFACHELFLVPGGRYLVTHGLNYLDVWDLGYVSEADPPLQPTKIWVTVVDHVIGFLVNPTVDGMGIRILAYSHDKVVYVFEIYPRKEIVQVAKLAELILDFLDEDWDDLTYFLYGNRVIIYARSEAIIIVWDFMANTMASWSFSMPLDLDTTCSLIFRATETAIMILHINDSNHLLWIFQIPSLVSKTPIFGTKQELPEVVAPILTFEYFDASATAGFLVPDCWYHSDLSSIPLYFDVVKSSQQSNVGRYELNIASDLSNLSLVPSTANRLPISILENDFYDQTPYRICENSFVDVCNDSSLSTSDITLKATTLGFHLSPNLADDSSHILAIKWHGYSLIPLYTFCPASGRLVHGSHVGGAYIYDFL